MSRENKPSYWKVLRRLTKESGSINPIPPLRSNDTDESPNIFSDFDKAEALNSYFASI